LEILIEELHGSLWVAALEKGRLEGLEVDPVTEEVRWGSIYWAKVARIDASLDAAFLNLDGDNIGILYNSDVKIKVKGQKGVYKKGGDVAIGKVLRPGQMIAVQAKSGFLPKDASEPHSKAENKGPRMSMNISLPGRYMIFTPFETENRVSRRIRDKRVRKQLMSMLDGMEDVQGCILRNSSSGVQTDVLIREAKILREVWAQVQKFFEGEDSSLIMLGPDAIQRTLSDNAHAQLTAIELTTMDRYQETEEWCEVYAPDLVTRIMPIELPDPGLDLGLFAFRDVIGQIEDVFQPYVILAEGSSIIIQETAALTAIDVNSGADSRGHLAVNIDAAREIAKQLRLRNLGGAILIDFLKSKDKEDENRIKKVLQEAFDEDPCTVQFHGFTKLGMAELTRNRRTPPLLERFESAVI
jgi:Rne/Rng family ribonuclease